MPDNNAPRSPAERTTQIFGEDPSSTPKLSKALFDKVLAKRAEKRAEEAEKVVDSLLDKLATFQAQEKQLTQKYNEGLNSFKKERAKLLTKVEAAMRGLEAPPDTEPTDGVAGTGDDT